MGWTNSQLPAGTVTVEKEELWEGVNFIDYDGTLLETWTPQETAQKTALPPIPEHEYLTNPEWNQDLADIKDYMQNCPDAQLWVGATYETVNGDTILWVFIEKGYDNPTISFAVNGTATIDWGDGTTDTVTGTDTTTVINTSHQYQSYGDFKITISTQSEIYPKGPSLHSQFYWDGINTSSLSATTEKLRMNIKKCYTGNVKLTSTNNVAFYKNFININEIVISKNTTGMATQCFNNIQCHSLIMPKNNFGNYNYVVNSRLKRYSSPYIDCVTPFLSTGLNAITIPKNKKTNVEVYTTTTGTATKISMYNDAESDTNVTFSNYCFYQFKYLTSFRIPFKTTSIGSNTFNGCVSLQELHFLPTTPPTVTGSTAFNNVPTTCKIYVPRGSLEDYTTATNYPDSTVYTYVEE